MHPLLLLALEFLTSETGLKLVGTALGFLFALFVAKRWKHAKAFKEGVALASEAASKIAPHTKTRIDDKLAVFLAEFRKHLEDKNVPVTPKTEDKAKAAFLAAVEGK